MGLGGLKSVTCSQPRVVELQPLTVARRLALLAASSSPARSTRTSYGATWGTELLPSLAPTPTRHWRMHTCHGHCYPAWDTNTSTQTIRWLGMQWQFLCALNQIRGHHRRFDHRCKKLSIDSDLPGNPGLSVKCNPWVYTPRNANVHDNTKQCKAATKLVIRPHFCFLCSNMQP